MSDSMDDLLRKSQAAAKAKADRKKAEEDKAAREAALEQRGHLAFQHVLDRVKAMVEEFNCRSTSGRINTTDRGRGVWEFFMPNTSNVLTLSGSVNPKPRPIRGKQCGIMATLSEHGGRGIHFLLLEDETSADKNEWAAVRVTNNPISRPRSDVEPFITSLDEITVGTRGMHVVVPEFSNDIDAAIREMLGYGLSG